ncbi:MAG TPA: PKD domain-containing protein [Planctomycetota bacterium]|jgi:hypothetical protein
MQSRSKLKTGLAIVSILVSILLALPAHGYCFLVNSAAVPLRWNLAALPNQAIRWAVQDGAPSMVHDCAIDCTNQWSSNANGEIAFTEGPKGILIVWDPGGLLIPNSQYLAYTTLTADANGNIASAVIVINAKFYNWHRGGDGGVSLLPGPDGLRDACLDSVLLHELGHALGLDHSDKDPSKIVGPTGPNDLPTMNSIIYPGSQILHLDDITGIRALYSNGTFSPPPATFDVAASPSSGRPPLKVFLSQSEDPNADALWDFGDGTAGLGPNEVHKYTTVGTFTVQAQLRGKTGTVNIVLDRHAKKRPPLRKEKPLKTGYKAGQW